jgi:hypothetical protein
MEIRSGLATLALLRHHVRPDDDGPDGFFDRNKEPDQKGLLFQDMAVPNMVKNRKLSKAINRARRQSAACSAGYTVHRRGHLGGVDPGIRRASRSVCGQLPASSGLPARRWTRVRVAAPRHDWDVNAAKNQECRGPGGG